MIPSLIIGGRYNHWGKPPPALTTKEKIGGTPNKLLDTIGVTENECAINKSGKGECIPKHLQKVIAKKLGTTVKGFRETINTEKIKERCDTDMCVFRKHLKGDLIGHIQKFYRPKGPSDNLDWLSNFQIQDVLEQLSKKIPGFEYPNCQMRDFAKVKTELARVDIHELFSRGAKYYGVVMNTDVSSGTGEHWNVLMVSKIDNKIHIEFFDSTARNIPSEVNTWILQTAEKLRLKGHTVVIDRNYGVELQKEDHSCGIWSLIYIFARVSGMSISQILRNIDENTMSEARTRLFSGSE